MKLTRAEGSEVCPLGNDCPHQREMTPEESMAAEKRCNDLLYGGFDPNDEMQEPLEYDVRDVV